MSLRSVISKMLRVSFLTMIKTSKFATAMNDIFEELWTVCKRYKQTLKILNILSHLAVMLSDNQNDLKFKFLKQ